MTSDACASSLCTGTSRTCRAPTLPARRRGHQRLSIEAQVARRNRQQMPADAHQLHAVAPGLTAAFPAVLQLVAAHPGQHRRHRMLDGFHGGGEVANVEGCGLDDEDDRFMAGVNQVGHQVLPNFHILGMSEIAAGAQAIGNDGCEVAAGGDVNECQVH